MILDVLLAAVGYRQEWHICWRAATPSGRHIYGDGTYSIQPRLTASTILKLREYTAEQASGAAGFRVEPSQIFIMSMTRIGA